MSLLFQRTAGGAVPASLPACALRGGPSWFGCELGWEAETASRRRAGTSQVLMLLLFPCCLPCAGAQRALGSLNPQHRGPGLLCGGQGQIQASSRGEEGRPGRAGKGRDWKGGRESRDRRVLPCLTGPDSRPAALYRAVSHKEQGRGPKREEEALRNRESKKRQSSR